MTTDKRSKEATKNAQKLIILICNANTIRNVVTMMTFDLTLTSASDGHLANHCRHRVISSQIQLYQPIIIK